jgi:hypothetical protein
MLVDPGGATVVLSAGAVIVPELQVCAQPSAAISKVAATTSVKHRVARAAAYASWSNCMAFPPTESTCALSL